jgi:hypothetical protein
VRRFLRELREYAGRFITNWSTYDAPLAVKVGLLVRNRFRATILLQGCCGHHGQPGC